MTEQLVFYTHPHSRGRIVRWLLTELGVAYRTEIVPYGAAMKDPAYLAINPMGKVPAIAHGDTVVTETAAICAYLADAFPDAGLAPPPDRRAAYYRWLFFGAGPFEGVLTQYMCGFDVPAAKQYMVGFGTYPGVLDALAQTLDNQPYLAGSVFTAADVYLGSQIGWSVRAGHAEGYPALADYWSRLAARPAYARAKALDDAAEGEVAP